MQLPIIQRVLTPLAWWISKSSLQLPWEILQLSSIWSGRQAGLGLTGPAPKMSRGREHKVKWGLWGVQIPGRKLPPAPSPHRGWRGGGDWGQEPLWASLLPSRLSGRGARVRLWVPQHNPIWLKEVSGNELKRPKEKRTRWQYILLAPSTQRGSGEKRERRHK